MDRSLVERQFGPSARAYAECEVHRSGRSLARLVELAEPQPHWRALDIATGAGHTALAFAPHVADVVATDITPEMLAETGALARERGVGNLTTAIADAAALPLDDASVDLVSCRLAAHHFSSIRDFVVEAARVLRPGGRLAVVDNVPPDLETVPGLAEADVADAEEAYHQFEVMRDPSHAQALSRLQWLVVITSAGLLPRHGELIEKEMAFTPWVERMRCAPSTVERLRALATAATPLGRFLKVRDGDGDLHLTLREFIVIAEKPDPDRTVPPNPAGQA